MRGRGPVVDLDRSQKVRMIHAVLDDYRGEPVKNLRTLDIGCGNGGISEFFAAFNEHFAVDIADNRREGPNAFTFTLVSDEGLPHEPGFFDIVISNHVIEHVEDQRRHLLEIGRVLKPDGCVYLATPNRSSPIMEGHVGNDHVLRYREMAPLFTSCGFCSVEYGLKVAKHPAKFNGEVGWAKHIPTTALRLIRPLFPSHIFVLHK